MILGYNGFKNCRVRGNRHARCRLLLLEFADPGCKLLRYWQAAGLPYLYRARGCNGILFHGRGSLWNV